MATSVVEHPPLSDAGFLALVGSILQADTESFPVLLQKILALTEQTWPPLRASVTLAGGVVVVTGQSEFPSGGPVLSFALKRGKRSLGQLALEVPDSSASDLLPSHELWEVLALILGQEAELRRLGRSPALAAGDLIGSSGVMTEVLRLLERAAAIATPVLILGESGVGKQRLAEALHARSISSQGPFVVFNGTALPESMVESELFGHPKGLGGRFAEAKGGTLFLDEVGDLSLPVQVRLLRAIDELPGALRVVASSSRSLEALIASGRFRSDLYARLAVFTLQVPPLRDRGADIIALADHFTATFSLQTGKEVKRISTPALEMLLTYPWPGNVRELATVMERAVLLSDDEVLHGYHLPPSLQSSVYSGTRMPGRLADRLDSLEYEMLVEALKASMGNITQAARELGLTKRIMGLRLNKFELDYRTFRKNPSDLADEKD